MSSSAAWTGHRVGPGIRRLARLGLIPALVLLSGCCWRAPCCAPPARASRPALPAEREAARRHGPGMAGVWSYLAATYDADGDGRITSAEYTRDEQTFRRLDRDGDEALTAADFEGPARMDRAIARLVLARHLRDPARKGPPQADEVAAAFARMDGDGSGTIDRRELDRTLAASRPLPGGSPPEVPKGVHVFDSLLALLDTDGSRDLSLAEVEAFRATMVARAMAARAAAEGKPRPERPEGPAMGEPAPDFTLHTLDGEVEVTLADYRGKQPVALIFGSWT